jgi:hypothetical protein
VSDTVSSDREVCNSLLVFQYNTYLLIYILFYHFCIYLHMYTLFGQYNTYLLIYILFYHFYIYLHMYTLLGPSAPLVPPQQNLFWPLVLLFCWRENTGVDKKDKAFLLVWEKDSSTERFLVLLPHIRVLQPSLVHLCRKSSLHASPLPIVASASLRLQYSLLYTFKF